MAAVNAGGTSPLSNEASGTPVGLPPTPTGVSATAGVGQVKVTWNASSGASWYNVYRSTSSDAEGTTPWKSGINGTSFTDTGLTRGVRYYYKVAAVNAAGTSGQSREVSAKAQ